MFTITLPDGATKQFEEPLDGLAFAKSIAPSLGKKALALKVDGELTDLSLPLDRDATVEIVTANTPDGLEIMRHDCAHIMAEAVQELFPGTQVTIGPVIENGFFYDFARDEPFSSDDLETIENKMKEIVDRNEPIVREVWNRDEAIAHFLEIGEAYKAEIIGSIPAGEDVTLYRQGTWKDLCRGPHLPSTGKLGKAFKLTKLAGAYWRGDSNNPMLQRIYGTCWSTEAELQDYLTMIEEAEKRDHRRIGKEMDLFHFQEEAQGMVFWHEKGWTLYRTVETYLRRKLEKHDYGEVRTPQLVDRKLWELSGHWDKFREAMFVTEADERVLALKPMNCPCHIEIFKQGLKSYRDLPLRMAEFGSCHRYEPSGALHGIMRVRGFTQDDAHIFCTEDQITSETEAFCAILQEVYQDLGFNDIRIMFSDRPEVRVGDDAVWDQSEKALLDAVKATGLPYELTPGEGAFYGPKIEFHLRDAIGRSWQCGTLQVDFNLPSRLGATYIGEDGAKHVPVMLHRAILGSMERFLGILIEEHEGKFPLWLAPTQIMVCPITTEANVYAQEVVDAMKLSGLRAEADLRNEKINYKVREHSLSKTPVILAVGKREAEDKTVSMRRLGSPDQTVSSLSDAVRELELEARHPDMR
ncbi:threonine--tRNA ligase [Alphaproteobacteria bacterium]|nr:threonine--tRNA ligase [Alphaproteobacteria bacterium]